jgi:hypothetical protein
MTVAFSERDALIERIKTLSERQVIELKEVIDQMPYESDPITDVRETDPEWHIKLVEAFAPVRQAIEAAGFTEEEINRDIDEAIAEVRRERKAQRGT